MVTYYCVLLLFSSVSVFAEKEPPPPQNQPPPPGLPIDGGIYFVLIASVAYAIYAVKKLKN